MKRFILFLLSFFIVLAGCQESKSVTVKFDSNGGNGVMKECVVEAGKELTLPANAFKRDDYTFKSWNSKKDGSGKTYADKEKITPQEDLTLYAQWTLVKAGSVSDLQALAGDGEVTLTWTAPEGNWDKIVISVEGSDTSIEVTDKTVTSGKITGLTNHSSYTFTVTVYCGSIAGDPVTVTATPGIALESVALSLPQDGIGNTTVSVTETLSPANAYVKDVTVTAAEAAPLVYDRGNAVLRLPSNRSQAPADYILTFTYTTSNDETKTVDVRITVYPDSFVYRNEKLYQPVSVYSDFSDTNTDITVNNAPAEEGSVTRSAEGISFQVKSLPDDNTDHTLKTSVTFDNVTGAETETTLGWLMEMSVVYSDVTNIRGILQFDSGVSDNPPFFYLLRNTYYGAVGNGTAFRVGKYSKLGTNHAASLLKHNMKSGVPMLLGYLFDGIGRPDTAVTTNAVTFFRDGKMITLPLNSNTQNDYEEAQAVTAPTLGDTFTLTVSRDNKAGQNVTDNGTLTIQKVVFYKPYSTTGN